MVYILMFSQPLGNERHRAQFYIGSCHDHLLNDRLAQHRSGKGAAITKAAVERGFTINLVATLPGMREEERRLKRQKNTPRLVKQLRKKGLINDNAYSCV